MKSLFLLLAFLSCSAMAAPDDLYLDCVFPPSKTSTKDPVAKKWLNDPLLIGMQFVLRLNPLIIVAGPGAQKDGLKDMLWGIPIVTATEEKITLAFPNMNAAPINRGIAYDIIINRFDGQAVRIFSMYERPGLVGKRFVYDAQTGNCQVSKRQI